MKVSQYTVPTLLFLSAPVIFLLTMSTFDDVMKVVGVLLTISVLAMITHPMKHIHVRSRGRIK